MGECYSCQSRSGKQTYVYYASDMSISSNPTPYSGVRRFSGPLTSKPRKSSPNNNARVRNSNEQLANEEERAALATITNGPSNLTSSNTKSKSQPSITQLGGSRFGFRRGGKVRVPGADSNSNITGTGVTSSTDSLDSYGPEGKSKAERVGLAKRHQPAQRPTFMSIGDSFAPAQMARWRMIDDSDTGTLTSMSLSPSTPSDAMLKLLTGDAQRNTDTNGNNMNTENSVNVVSQKQGKSHSERKPYSRIPSVGTSRMSTKLQRPSASSTVTSSSTSSSSVPEQGQNENKQVKNQVKNKPARRFVGGWFGRKSNSHDTKSSQLQNEKSQPQKEFKNKANLSKSNVQSQQLFKTDEKHLDSNLNEAEGSGEAMAEPEKDNEFEEKEKPVSKTKIDAKEIVIETEIISGPVHTSNIPDVDTKAIDMEKSTPQKRTLSSESQGSAHGGSHVPLAQEDSLDSSSICSLNSDDLMLDIDLDDPAEQSLDRCALRQKLGRKASAGGRGRLFSTEDDFQEEEEDDDGNKNHPAVDKAVHAAVVSQMQAAVPYTPSTPSVPSSPDVISSSTSRSSEPISPLISDVPSRVPKKPQFLKLREPLLGTRSPSSAEQVVSMPSSRLKEGNAETSDLKAQTSKNAVPIQRRSLDSPGSLRPRVNSASEAVEELSSLASQLSLSSPLNESHLVQRYPSAFLFTIKPRYLFVFICV